MTPRKSRLEARTTIMRQFLLYRELLVCNQQGIELVVRASSLLFLGFQPVRRERYVRILV